MAFLLRALGLRKPTPSYPAPKSLVIPPDTVNGAAGIDPRRYPPLPNGINFRDLGGYPTADGKHVRWGVVYRSGSFGKLDSDGLDYIAKLGLKMVCDLRSHDEIKAAPEALVGVQNEHIPIEVENETTMRLRALLFNPARLEDMLIKVYTETMIGQNAAVFRAVFERLANPQNLPMLIRCTAGKDRTGMTVAVILLALGVAEETVVADYSLSNLYFEDFQAFARTAIKPLGIMGIGVQDLTPILIADPKVLRRAIAYLRNEFGSIDAYLRNQCGISEATLAAVRANLLE
jgi:protein-tyrosine phosphatase